MWCAWKYWGVVWGLFALPYVLYWLFGINGLLIAVALGSVYVFMSENWGLALLYLVSIVSCGYPVLYFVVVIVSVLVMMPYSPLTKHCIGLPVRPLGDYYVLVVHDWFLRKRFVVYVIGSLDKFLLDGRCYPLDDISWELLRECGAACFEVFL